jgi:hypothetical protein
MPAPTNGVKALQHKARRHTISFVRLSHFFLNASTIVMSVGFVVLVQSVRRDARQPLLTDVGGAQASRKCGDGARTTPIALRFDGLDGIE